MYSTPLNPVCLLPHGSLPLSEKGQSFALHRKPQDGNSEEAKVFFFCLPGSENTLLTASGPARPVGCWQPDLDDDGPNPGKWSPEIGYTCTVHTWLIFSLVDDWMEERRSRGGGGGGEDWDVSCLTAITGKLPDERERESERCRHLDDVGDALHAFGKTKNTKRAVLASWPPGKSTLEKDGVVQR